MKPVRPARESAREAHPGDPDGGTPGRPDAAGDAAGLADEFTQEGIYYAIESGRIAANLISRLYGVDFVSKNTEV